jgi:hypothetical protein
MINYKIAQKLSTKIKLKNGRKSFRFLGRDYIIGVRSVVNNGYKLTAPKGKQSRKREFYKIDLGYITLYRSAKAYNWWFVTKKNQNNHTLKSLF